MTKQFKDKIGKAIYKTITQAIGRGGAIDPIDLSERLLDNVEFVHDLEFEDSGIASIPEEMRGAGDAAWDIRQNAPAAAADTSDDRPHFLAPPPAKAAATPVGAAGKDKSVIIMPGDAGFDSRALSAGATDKGTEKPGVIKATQVRRRAIVRPGSNAPQKQYWHEADLIEAIDKATPAEIPFDIQRNDGSSFHIVAKKNILNKQGLGGVVLTYKDPRVSDGGNIPLVAQAPFSLYDEEIDVDAGLKSIVGQLVGIYKDRSGGATEPMAVGPEPNLAAMLSQKYGVGDDAGYQMTSGARSTQDPFVGKDQDQILQNALRSQRQANDRLPGAGRRFDVPVK